MTNISPGVHYDDPDTYAPVSTDSPGDLVVGAATQSVGVIRDAGGSLVVELLAAQLRLEITTAPSGAPNTTTLTVTVRNAMGQGIKGASVLIALRSDAPLIAAANAGSSLLASLILSGGYGLAAMRSGNGGVVELDVEGTAAASGDAVVTVMAPGVVVDEADPWTF